MIFLNQNSLITQSDLHLIMAALITMGKYMEFTGIPDVYIESRIFDDATVHHLLNGKSGRK